MKETTELIRKLERAGCVVTRSKKNRHLRVLMPNGSTHFTSSTPSEPRAYKNFVAKMRRNGLDI